ncbi:iron chaperone [Flavobacterium sp.]|uniref:iron chaperone n=1 Tax=Flavobacterium sp. TaxID=239 RepID=UPI003752E4A3
METKKYTSIDEYIADFPENVAIILNKIRNCIQLSAPNAKETISYNMPAFKQKKVLVYFSSFKNHIGFYALPSGNKAFQEEISKYKTEKGSIQFPLNDEIPYKLIKKIVGFRVKEIDD